MAKTQVATQWNRALSKSEIELLKEIRTKGAELLRLHAKVKSVVEQDRSMKIEAAKRVFRQHRDNKDEFDLQSFERAEPGKWLQVSRTDIQRGLMALERAIIRPIDD